MKHQEYIENQLNIIRFSSDRAFDIAKFHGALEYLFYSKVISSDELNFYLNRAIAFLHNPEAYPVKENANYVHWRD